MKSSGSKITEWCRLDRKTARVNELYLKLLVNHSLTYVSDRYAGQRPLMLPDLIREQEKVTTSLTASARTDTRS